MQSWMMRSSHLMPLLRWRCASAPLRWMLPGATCYPSNVSATATAVSRIVLPFSVWDRTPRYYSTTTIDNNPNSKSKGITNEPGKLPEGNDVLEIPTIHKWLVDYQANQISKDTSVTIQGWISSTRAHKRVMFIEMNDGSSQTDLQCVVATPSLLTDFFGQTQYGSCLKIVGKLQSNKDARGVELLVESIEVVGPSNPTEYPLQKKAMTWEYLLQHAHLRGRTRTYRNVMKVRSAMTLILHEYFQKQDFFHVHTPILTSNDCEGGGEMFRIDPLSGIKLEDCKDAKATEEVKPYFPCPVHLTVSGQLHAEALASGLSRVYVLGPTFRAERKSFTKRHLCEFWMLEAEMYHIRKLDSVLNCVEDFVRRMAQQLREKYKAEIFFLFQQNNPEMKREDCEKFFETLITKPFARITYEKAVEMLINSGQKYSHRPKFGEALQTEHENYIASQFDTPVFVTDYPQKVKAFYMRVNEEMTNGIPTVGAFDLLVPQLGEIAGGSLREERIDVLKKNIQDFGLNEPDYEWYLDLRRFGGSPHGGFGIGFERLVMYFTGMKNIREVIPFPRTPEHCSF